MHSASDNLKTDSIPVDQEVIQSLRGILREEFDTVLQSFLNNSRRNLSLIELGISENDRVSIIMTAHKVASSAGQLGLVRMSLLAREIEMCAGHADVLELKILHEEAEKAFTDAIRIIQDLY